MRIACILAAILATSVCTGQEAAYRFDKVFDSSDIPWGMVWLPDGDMLVTERSGRLLRVAGNDTASEIDGVPELYLNWHAGLLDIELHPDYANNGWLYIAYTSPEGSGDGGNTAIMRARLEDDTLVDKKVVYKASPNSTSRDHYGARIEFDDDGYLYFSFGDNYNHEVNPQDIRKDGGKIYRLYDDGGLPEDNPFYRQPGAKPAIYSFGHRNPQGMARHPETGQIWIHEHGPQGGDEINIIRPGRNYGWPIISYGIDYDGSIIAEGTHREGMEQPEWQWTPSIAPSGMVFVTGDRYPELKGHLLVGSLKFAYVSLCNLGDDAVSCDETVFDNIGRVRNVRQGPDGFIYVAVDGAGIYRILPRGN